MTKEKPSAYGRRVRQEKTIEGTTYAVTYEHKQTVQGVLLEKWNLRRIDKGASPVIGHAFLPLGSTTEDAIARLLS